MNILPSEPKNQSKPVVLVVDDDHTHQKMMVLLASRLGITAIPATSCAEAIEAMQIGAFDAILMDYRMPGVNGCECTRQIRTMKEVTGDIPIIAVTAHLVPSVEIELKESGMVDFLSKPFTMVELETILSKWLKK